MTLLEANVGSSASSVTDKLHGLQALLLSLYLSFHLRGMGGGMLAFLRGISDVIPWNWPSAYTVHTHTEALMR